MKPRLKVGVDASQVGRKGKGHSRFIVSWLWTLAGDAPEDIDWLVYVARGADLPPLPEHPRVRYLPVKTRPGLWWDFFGWDADLRAAGADLAFVMVERKRISVPYVLYLFEIPDYRVRNNRQWAGPLRRLSDALTLAGFRNMLRRAEHVIAASHFTGEDLTGKYRLRPDKVSVVHPASDGMFGASADAAEAEVARRRFCSEGGYLLHFSSDNDPRDNTPAVLRAFAAWSSRENHGKRLVIAGIDDPRRYRWKDLIGRLDLDGKVTLAPFLTGEDLVRAYRGADVYVDPSLIEGFGFQVAEALACGVPVICSRTGSLPEVAGQAAVLVDPGDAGGLAGAMQAVASDEALRRRLREAAGRQSSKFDWRRSSEKLTALIRRVAGRGEE